MVKRNKRAKLMKIGTFCLPKKLKILLKANHLIGLMRKRLTILRMSSLKTGIPFLRKSKILRLRNLMIGMMN